MPHFITKYLCSEHKIICVKHIASFLTKLNVLFYILFVLFFIKLPRKL